jgi:hypothetical protein
MSEIGPAAEPHEVGGRLNIPRRIRISCFDDANRRCSAFEGRDVHKFGSVPAQGAQPIQSGSPSRDEGLPQLKTLGCLGRVSRSRGIIAGREMAAALHVDKLMAL